MDIMEKAHSITHDREFSFSHMKLMVGDKIQIQVPASVSYVKHTVRLIGFYENVSILISPPYENGLSLPLCEGEMIVVKAFSGQHAFGFTSTLDTIIRQPFHYLHISYPEKVQGMMIRKFPRVQTKLQCSVDGRTNDVHASCIITDLSLNGASIYSAQPLGEKGDPINIALQIDPMGLLSNLIIESLIRSVSKEASDHPDFKMHYGVEFQGLDPNQKMILSSYIYEETLRAETIEEEPQ